MRSVVRAFPETEGVLFELPEVVQALGPVAGIELVAGDFFRNALPVADCYLLMNVVHDWDDDAAVAILRAVAAAGASPRATALLLEAVLPDGTGDHWAKTLDVMMLAMTGGRERTPGPVRRPSRQGGPDPDASESHAYRLLGDPGVGPVGTMQPIGVSQGLFVRSGQQLPPSSEGVLRWHTPLECRYDIHPLLSAGYGIAAVTSVTATWSNDGNAYGKPAAVDQER